MLVKKSLILQATKSSAQLRAQAGRARHLTVVPSFTSGGHLKNKEQKPNQQDDHAMATAVGSPVAISTDKCQARLDHLNLWHSVETLKRLGYRMASLDPLELSKPKALKDLTWSYPLIEELKNKQDLVQTNGFLDTKQPFMTVSELLDSIYSIYVDKECGIEFEHMTNQQEVEWLTSKWEKFNELFHFDKLVEQQELAKLLLECETFDHFMAAKYPTTKRYGCEGAESMLVVFDEILRLCQHGLPTHQGLKSSTVMADDDKELIQSIGRIDDVIIAMPHRGRLNLLACLLDFEPGAIFHKTRGECELDTREAWMATGDVLSHLSTNVRYVYGLDRSDIGLSRDTPEPINVSLLPNPSHLEVCSPVCVGTARGRARNVHYNYLSSPRFIHNKVEHASPADTNGTVEAAYTSHFSTILPIQVHGDASVSGQGIVQETLQMANLSNFTVGGSLHIVVNNQIGYTTDSSKGRSSRHCTDIFKLTEAPIIHVNGQNIESVLRATRLALAYRQNFGKDVVIDLICYRQHGHNEMDEPSFTQPIMYETIRNRKSIPQIYCDKICLDESKRKQIVESFKGKLNEQYKESLKIYKPDNDNYRNFSLPTEYHRDHLLNWQTGCPLEKLRTIALASVDTPSQFNVHPNLQRVLVGERRQRFAQSPISSIKVDWASAEMLAFGSLLDQNHSVRLAGQDVARGTFSTRHAILFDQKTGQPYVPLNNMNLGSDKPQTQLEVCNTILSEEAALAYEFGYSTETCALTIWEAQFGDFFSTAQSIIDTLISSSETKWLKQSAITLLLPHGLDGAGPEHSSSHIERFLQLSSSRLGDDGSIDTEANTNWSICFPTLPSQYFHLLRRQVLRPFRKPLVLMSPKVIFRHPDCVSALSDFDMDKTFEPVLDDPTVASCERDHIDTLVLCSGKIYFTLKEEKLRNGLHNVAILRIEELCPFPVNAILQHLKQYPNAMENLIWFQEEHKNQGAYNFVDSRLNRFLKSKIRYIGRRESELPAVGSSLLHKREHEQILSEFRNLRKRV